MNTLVKQLSLCFAVAILIGIFSSCGSASAELEDSDNQTQTSVEEDSTLETDNVTVVSGQAQDTEQDASNDSTIEEESDVEETTSNQGTSDPSEEAEQAQDTTQAASDTGPDPEEVSDEGPSAQETSDLPVDASQSQSSEETASDAAANVEEAASSEASYNFETDCIKIYREADGFSTPIEITDASAINEIVSAIDTASWEEASLENELSATPAFFIDFCNGTVVSMLSDVGYGSIGTAFYAQTDEEGELLSFGLENGDGPFYFNDGLYEEIMQAVS